VAKSIEDTIRDAGVNDDDAANAKRLSGYLGNSGVATRTRLYLNTQLNEFIELATDDIIKIIDLGGKNSPHVLLLVPSGTLVHHTTLQSEQIQADFLAGVIAQRNLQADRVRWVPGSGPEELGPTHVCRSIICQSIGTDCAQGRPR
jgi:hypothetical protein